MIAIVSDLHSNIESLSVVLAEIERLKCEQIWCLGDIIGYGPDPSPCVEIARTRFEFSLVGNHEFALLNEALGFNKAATGAINYTRDELKPSWYSGGTKKANWRYLEGLPTRVERDGMLFVHASPANETEEYLLRMDVDEVMRQLSPKLERAFGKMDVNTCFVGHTHYPGVITEDAKFYAPTDLDDGVYEIPTDQKVIINVGSTGQPRDGDTRACFVTLDGGRVQFHRLAYDHQTTCKKILKIAALEDSLGERLLRGG